MFNLWSEGNIDIMNALKPDLGLRFFDSLSAKERELMWQHLNVYFFDNRKLVYNQYDYGHEFTNEHKMGYTFYNPNSVQKRKRIDSAIYWIYKSYKVKNYAENFITDYSHFSACQDFNNIFLKAEGNAVLELLSFYCKALLSERKGEFYREKAVTETEKSYQKDIQNWEYGDFDEFSKDINEVFGDFGLNVYLTRNGFIPKQDNKIIEEIFEPVLRCLINPQWNDVNKLMSDAFSEYRKNTPNGYSTCVTHIVSAIQAYLQIIVNGKIGSGEISKLITQAQNKNLIPSDSFTKEIFKPIESILMRERQETGDAHPKKEYATEQNAKLVLNLSMIFLQHCLTV